MSKKEESEVISRKRGSKLYAKIKRVVNTDLIHLLPVISDFHLDSYAIIIYRGNRIIKQLWLTDYWEWRKSQLELPVADQS